MDANGARTELVDERRRDTRAQRIAGGEHDHAPERGIVRLVGVGRRGAPMGMVIGMEQELAQPVAQRARPREALLALHLRQQFQVPSSADDDVSVRDELPKVGGQQRPPTVLDADDLDHGRHPMPRRGLGRRRRLS